MSIEPIDRRAAIKKIFAVFLPFVVKSPAQTKPAAIPLLRDGQTINAQWLDSIAKRVNELSKGQNG